MQIHGTTVRFGVHSGQQYATVDEYEALWQRAETLGYDWVSAFDHFRPPDRPRGPCFEGTAILAAMSARTRRVRCGMLVLAVPYRHPAVVANLAATIDHISGGRLELGLGIGGPDLGQEQYGMALPPVGARLAMLDETCRILRALWTQESTTFTGRHYQLREAQLEPKPLQTRLPLLIGGGGERRMLRMVAQHADIWNTFAGNVDACRHKLAALAAHCATVGRQPADIRTSLLFRAVLADKEADAARRADELLGPGSSDARRAAGYVAIGTPEQCVDELRRYRALGVGDFLLGVRSAVDWETLELVARRVAPALRAAT